ncbi:sulfite exporter TauE/SafE family protein [Kineobactrum sediminis]|uniref:Probable membrane transporter protein n=1 Tax=Kineobactrum sediminis TaxID=1905677 RepID=A0A2N5Y006_9GAMM|nr:sulfite exporter TauE/SafE family protein [Kineobactrum sediminis]PLW81731.1 sulfite exporter TauE/SafE family protein [Kineobactrum sediminis]
MPDAVAQIGLWPLVSVAGIVVFAAVLRAFTGFGFGLAAVPVFSLVMPPPEAVVLSTGLTLAVSLITLRSYWGQAPLRPMLPLFPAAALGTVVGVGLLTRVSVEQFQLWIGISVIFACIVLTFYRPAPRVPRQSVTVATGLAAGLLNGAFAIPGPPVVIYAMATEREPYRARALLITFFLFSSVVALISFSVAGFVSARSPWLFMLALPSMLIGDKIGYLLFRRYGGTLYRRVALLVLLAVGAATIARALW